MPTIHVTADCESQLQDIANSLWKARKVVVITGAGISTNSGIPVSRRAFECNAVMLCFFASLPQDFRSENGLYTLIQAQFDAAAARRLPDWPTGAAAKMLRSHQT